MLIHLKNIVEERTEDAPFVGALVIAADCTRGCKGCFNQDLKNIQTSCMDLQDLYKYVTKNPFNKGFILGGLEWMEQPYELLALSSLIISMGKELMIYTGFLEETFFNTMPRSQFHRCYIKFGKYMEELSVPNYYSHGVKLASANQYIKWFE